MSLETAFLPSSGSVAVWLNLDGVTPEEFVLNALTWLFVALVVLPFLAWLFVGSGKSRVAKDGSSYGRISILLRIQGTLMYAFVALFFAPPVLVGNAGEPWHWLEMFVFAVLVLLTAGLWIARIRWNDTVLEATSPFLLINRSYRWEDLTLIEDRSKQYATVLHFDMGKEASISWGYQGCDDVIAYAKDRLDNA